MKYHGVCRVRSSWIGHTQARESSALHRSLLPPRSRISHSISGHFENTVNWVKTGRVVVGLCLVVYRSWGPLNDLLGFHTLQTARQRWKHTWWQRASGWASGKTMMPNNTDGKKDVLLSHGDSSAEVNTLSRTYDCVHKKLQMIGMPSFQFGSMPLFPLWCSGKACRGWDTAAHCAEGCYAKALSHDLCGLRGRLRILLVPSWKSGLNRGGWAHLNPRWHPLQWVMKRICQTFSCAVGKSASRQSASRSCTRAGTRNVDHGAHSRTAAATTGTSHAATSTTILSLTLLPQQVTQQKAMTVPPSTSALFLSPCKPPYCLQSLRGLPACLRDLCPQKRTQQEK